MNTIEKIPRSLFATLEELDIFQERQASSTLKHGRVAASFSAVMGGAWNPSMERGTNACRNVEPSMEPEPLPIPSLVSLSARIDDAVGFEPEAVWPVIAELWDKHNMVGRYDMGVIGVWFAGLGITLYVCGIGGSGFMYE